MMRTSYDPEADAFYVRFAPDGVATESTEEAALGVMIDLDTDGDVDVLGFIPDAVSPLIAFPIFVP